MPLLPAALGSVPTIGAAELPGGAGTGTIVVPPDPATVCVPDAPAAVAVTLADDGGARGTGLRLGCCGAGAGTIGTGFRLGCCGAGAGAGGFDGPGGGAPPPPTDGPGRGPREPPPLGLTGGALPGLGLLMGCGTPPLPPEEPPGPRVGAGAGLLGVCGLMMDPCAPPAPEVGVGVGGAGVLPGGTICVEVVVRVPNEGPPKAGIAVERYCAGSTVQPAKASSDGNCGESWLKPETKGCCEVAKK